MTTSTQAQGLTTFLVWTSGGLTDEFTAALEERFDVISIVAGDAAPLDIGDDQVVPLDAIAIDSRSYAPFDSNGATKSLEPGKVLLGETSASFRGAGPGGVLSFSGVPFQVAGVVPDEVVGAAEVVFSKADPNSPAVSDRYALISSDLEDAQFEALIESINEGPIPARVTAEGQTPYLRYANSVLPQVFIKLALDEFSYAAESGSQLVLDRDFVSNNIVTTEVPILGTITCHRVVVDMVTGAFNQLIDQGLEDLVDPGEFAGCWNPRFIRTVAGTPAGVSRHSWGAALDINARSNGLGSESTQDPRLVATMKEWGFLWGGEWAVPDPMHFEYGIPPER